MIPLFLNVKNKYKNIMFFCKEVSVNQYSIHRKYFSLNIFTLFYIKLALLPPKIKALQRQMSDMVEKETKLVEEKIRKFTENQLSALDEFRTKALNDYHALAR